jgi:hypothetical protein
MVSPKAKRQRSNYPPNPKQWPAERNGLKFREDFDIPLKEPLRPFDVQMQMNNVVLLRQNDLAELVDPNTLNQAYGPSRNKWDAATFRIDDRFIIIVNDTRPRTRQNATLMEEFFHIILKHKPSRIEQCRVTGLMQREYNRQLEEEAYWSAAAALVPYAPLRSFVENGITCCQIADNFEVSTDLVKFRLKTTRLYRKARLD